MTWAILVAKLFALVGFAQQGSCPDLSTPLEQQLQGVDVADHTGAVQRQQGAVQPVHIRTLEYGIGQYTERGFKSPTFVLTFQQMEMSQVFTGVYTDTTLLAFLSVIRSWILSMLEVNSS